MAKKKEADPNDPQTWAPAGVVNTIHPDDSELDEVLAALPQTEACIELFRINPQGGRPLFLESLQPSVFSLAYVTGKFGGGRYIASAKYIDGSRHKMPFEIEGEPIPVRLFFRSSAATLEFRLLGRPSLTRATRPSSPFF
jgi:hypothetical protein